VSSCTGRYVWLKTDLSMSRKFLDFDRINRAAMVRSLDILKRWLPDGQIEGAEYVALNPHRADKRRGSFKINWKTGRWADWSSGDRGGDLIALAAYLHRISQYEAAGRMAQMLGIDNG